MEMGLVGHNPCRRPTAGEGGSPAFGEPPKALGGIGWVVSSLCCWRRHTSPFSCVVRSPQLSPSTPEPSLWGSPEWIQPIPCAPSGTT